MLTLIQKLVLIALASDPTIWAKFLDAVDNSSDYTSEQKIQIRHLVGQLVKQHPRYIKNIGSHTIELLSLVCLGDFKTPLLGQPDDQLRQSLLSIFETVLMGVLQQTVTELNHTIQFNLDLQTIKEVLNENVAPNPE